MTEPPFGRCDWCVRPMHYRPYKKRWCTKKCFILRDEFTFRGRQHEFEFDAPAGKTQSIWD